MGPTYSISTACATSNFCILNAANHIIDGDAVSIVFAVIIVLGANIDFYSVENLSGHDALWWL